MYLSHLYSVIIFSLNIIAASTIASCDWYVQYDRLLASIT